jgi:hypothetical protein
LFSVADPDAAAAGAAGAATGAAGAAAAGATGATGTTGAAATGAGGAGAGAAFSSVVFAAFLVVFSFFFAIVLGSSIAIDTLVFKPLFNIAWGFHFW